MKNFLTAACLPVLLAACAHNGGMQASGGGYGSSDYGSAPAPRAAAAPAMAGLPLMVKDGHVVTTNGITVYVFDKDVANSGKSACNGDCAVKWPPVLASASDRPQGQFTIVTRDDGRRQWAYRGTPVYTWPEDQEPGDKYGDNYLKVWHVVPQ
jgi:predicted lipoprotein with Yx(FWY)xxD motif